MALEWVDITARLATPIYVVRDGACDDGSFPSVRWKGTTTTSPGAELSKVGDRWVMPGDGAVPETCPLAPSCGCLGYAYFVPVGLALDAPIPGVHGLRLRVQLPEAQQDFSGGGDHFLVSRDFAALNSDWSYDNSLIKQDPVGNAVGTDPGYEYPAGSVANASLISAIADSGAPQTLQVDYRDMGAGPFTLHSVSSLLLAAPCTDECATTRYGVYDGRPMYWVPLIQVFALIEAGPGAFWTDFERCREVTP
jgi:hypothetical protein